MIGKLILVSGRSGSGKTTMIKLSLNQIKNLIYLPTITTRKPRGEEFGYEFVKPKEYYELLTRNLLFDHSYIHNNFYGCKRNEVFENLNNGTNYITTCYPDKKEIENFENKYTKNLTKIIIDVPEKVSEQRLSFRDSLESKRLVRENQLYNKDLTKEFDIVFKPIGEIKKDVDRFVDLLKNVLHD